MMRALFIAAPVLALLTAEASAVGEITFSISKSPTANVSCSNGLCEPTGGNANLNVSDLETLLAAGNLQINAYNGKFHARTVTVKDGFSWSAATGLTLAKLDVGKTISILGAGSLTSALSVKKEGKIQCADLSCNVDGYTPVNSLQGLASAIAANPQGNYALVHSYDASADGTYTASPIATNFLGNLYGLGNTISNISVANTTACCVAGLFQSLSEGNIYDLHLTNVSVTSTAGAAGFAYESFAEIFNSSVTGSINGGSAGDIGGFVADNYGTIRSSWSTAAVSTASSLTNANVGGLVGVNYGGLLFTYSTAAVRAGASVTDVNIGGLAGSNLSGIQGSFATGNVSTGDGSGNIGGLAGLNSQSGYLEGTYAEGAVAGGAGLIVGGSLGENAYPQNDYYIQLSYSTGAVSGGNGSIVGGFIGENDSRYTADDYWDTTTSGTKIGVGLGNETSITGMTTAQLQSGLPPGFDARTWRETAGINDGLPYLRRNAPPK